MKSSKTNIIISEIKSLVNDYIYNGKVNILKLCERLNIEVYEVIFDDNNLSGVIDYSENQWRIRVNKNDSKFRQRFTIAHELGHYFSYKYNSYSYDELENQKWHSDTPYLNRGGESNNIEKEANKIAAEIIMPEELIKEYYNRGFTIENMSRVLEVSEIALGYRLHNLNIRTLEEY